MLRPLIAVLATSSLAGLGAPPSDSTASPNPSATSRDFLCSPEIGCSFTFVVTSVSVAAGTISGYNLAFPQDPLTTAQVTTGAVFQAPSGPCFPSDPMYPWQQLVAAGANRDPRDPLHTAFLSHMQLFTPVYAIHLKVSLDGRLNVVTAQPVSCTGQ